MYLYTSYTMCIHIYIYSYIFISLDAIMVAHNFACAQYWHPRSAPRVLKAASQIWRRQRLPNESLNCGGVRRNHGCAQSWLRTILVGASVRFMQHC